MKLCFFDSGIGGLDLLYTCACLMPYADMVYFADNGNVPYGSLTEEKIRLLTFDVFEKIAKEKPSAAVIACNTVTAVCAEELRKTFPFRIYGIQPAVKPAAKICGRCLVLATPRTAASLPLLRLVESYGRGVTHVLPCEGLASYIEENIFNLNRSEVEKLLPDFRADGVVLGCTHYAFVKQWIAEKYGCAVFDGAAATAANVCRNTAAEYPFSPYSGKITFKGGDVDRNERVFGLLKSKNN